MNNNSTDAPRGARVALVAGGSGLVGNELLRLLVGVDDYSRVHALSRRPLSLDHARLANRIVSFARLGEQLKGFACQDAYCCLGSTLRQAGSQAAFRAVDFDLVLAFAGAARAAGAQRVVLVSSVGADPGAKNFYLRVKGEAERALGSLGFASLDILQPGLLLGSRRELRPLELAARLVMPVLNPLLAGRLAPYRGIAARDVALAMLGAARSGRRGIHVYGGEALRALAIRTRAGLAVTPRL
jgi:uncharacterized protein YbjT (DUF2867 family)